MAEHEQKMGMADLHCHLLPGVDDGAASEEESCQMAHLAAESGVTAIAVTPHCNVPGQFKNYRDSVLEARFLRLRELLLHRKIPVTLYSGMEVYVTPEVPELLRKRRLLTLGGSRYLLVEFAFDEPCRYMERMLAEIRHAGCVPVVAHPERYYAIQEDPEILMDWARTDTVLQINKGSLFGMFGRHAARTAHWCMGEGCVHLIGSDAHSPYRRTPRLSDARDYAAELDSPEIADFLLRENPMRILNNQDVRPVLAEF